MKKLAAMSPRDKEKALDYKTFRRPPSDRKGICPGCMRVRRGPGPVFCDRFCEELYRKGREHSGKVLPWRKKRDISFSEEAKEIISGIVDDVQKYQPAEEPIYAQLSRAFKK